MLRLYRRSEVSGTELSKMVGVGINLTTELQAEWCFYVEVSSALTTTEMATLVWLLGETFDPDGLSDQSFLNGNPAVLEFGPRLNFETPWASTARQVCHHVGLQKITRVERSRRFGFSRKLGSGVQASLTDRLLDRMTEVTYAEPLRSFETGLTPAPVHWIPVIEQGMAALEAANQEFGLAMDEHDLAMFYELFVSVLKRNPTDVELFQLGQGNSEHSRHGWFRGKLELDGRPVGTSLMSIVQEPWRANPNNSVIAFHDDSSAIYGGEIMAFVASLPGEPGRLVRELRTLHPTFTAETHNFPTGIAPYPGAATGTGGRIRDNQCVGRGGLVVASGVGYCVANLHLPGYEQPWEDAREHPGHQASPLDILIQASNGASDYGNCFGEPVILGHVRTFGMDTPGGYRAWFRPIMFTAGVGLLDHQHVTKGTPQAGMLVVQLGGPAYRIGMGGGAASSMVSGENAVDLDFNAVQRGAPEMEQRVNRVIRACIERGRHNPIISAHDLGAGGDSNALPEIIDPAGGRIDLRAIPVGDSTLSVLEIWGNESQERNAVLIQPADFGVLQAICERENAPMDVVGEVTGDGQLVVVDSADGSTPVNLPLGPILGDIPPKIVKLQSVPVVLEPLDLPLDLTVEAALERVLRLVSVGSKRWLTNKVDRSVTGLIAQQQCVGPFHTPMSDYAVVAHSLFGNTGTALSQGERPLLGLISPSAQGRMTVGEALTNMMGARITGLADIRCSANWMWAAKLPGEGARLYEAALAMSNLMVELGMAIDGGKDSLSMASRDGDETIKAPGQLVIAPYAVMPDVTQKVTPEFKAEGNHLLLIDLSGGQARLGGSALAQVFRQLGDECPDVEDVDLFRRTFEAIQDLVGLGQIASLHDRSDGGLLVTLVEMAIAGNLGATIDVSAKTDTLSTLFSEELGIVVEVESGKLAGVVDFLNQREVPFAPIGWVGPANGNVAIIHNGSLVLDQAVSALRSLWEETSDRLDGQQANPVCVSQEAASRRGMLLVPDWRLSFQPQVSPSVTIKPAVAVIREEGSNGDREMAAAFLAAGFDVWDVTMSDLLAGTARLGRFQGLVFPGGFSYGDVLDAGKGWAGVIRFNPGLSRQFETFYERPDTFSLGVCNGAQLMALLGWVPFHALPDPEKPRFIGNQSGRFESRLSTVEILPSPAVLLRGMEGSRLGVWVAHGEGQLHVQPGQLSAITGQGLAPIRFVDADGRPTTRYPFNPNGSPEGITALCSPDGRHLAMMPHPERLSNQLWQWPWMPPSWSGLEASPWLRMFQNAYDWCINA